MALFHSKSSFLEAAAKGDVATIKDYLAHDAAGWLNAREKKTGDSAFHKAAESGHAEVIRLLIAAYDLAATPNNNGETPLARAVAYGRREAAQALLQSQNVLRAAAFPINRAIG